MSPRRAADVIHALLSDLDGTLVDRRGNIDHADVTALAAAGERGILRVLVTGRPSRCLSDVQHVLPLFDAVYASNGAELLGAAGEVIRREALGRDAVSTMVHRARAVLDDPVFALEYGSRFAFEADYSYWPATDNDSTAVVGRVEDLANARSEPVKLLIKARTQTCDLVVDRLNACGLDVTITHSIPFGAFGPVEVTSPQASKGAVATAIADQQGRQRAWMAAFGDRANDESMLAVVGYPVAVRAKGEPRLARFVQGRSVGHWLREHVL